VAGPRLLASTAGADAASILALCCTGAAVSVPHRAAQLAGIASTCSGLVVGLYLIWSSPVGGSTENGLLRAAAVLWIIAAASAHAALVLRWRRRGSPGRILVAGTVLCTGAAAELIANYALFPGFEPGNGYGRALAVILILDALGTILIMLIRRFGQPRLQVSGFEVRSKT
jgi:cytochrome bd-type quinol oxidase subunit 2